MRAKGLTDYVAWPVYHTLGKRHLVTFATDRPGGFDDAHIAALSKLLPVLALVSEIRMKNRLASRRDQVMALIAELVELGCADPAVDCEVSDPATGKMLAMAEACWPEGLQPGQGDPVILELDPADADLPRLEEIGYEVFTSIDALRGYVRRRNQEARGPGVESSLSAEPEGTPDEGDVPALDGGAETRASFERAMRNVYVRAKKEANYTATYFLTMLSEHGGLGTAHRLLASSEVSSGFAALYQRGRLDLTVEALVVKPESRAYSPKTRPKLPSSV